MDHILKYNEITTVTRDLPDDWRPVITPGWIWTSGTRGMEVTQAGTTIECQPASATYTTIAGVLAAVQLQLDAFAALGLPNAAITISLTGGGLVNISSTVPFDVDWFSTEIRDVLGFTADLAGTDTYTATILPALPKLAPTCTVTLYDAAGTVLDTGAADVPGWYETSASAARGARTLTAAAMWTAVADWRPGRRALLVTDGGGAVEHVEIAAASVAAGTWTLSLRERLEESHASGSYLIPWWVSYDLDATTVVDWPVGRRGTIRWAPTAVFETYADFVDTWDLRSALRDLTAVERLFRALSPRMAEVVRDQAVFEILVEDAEAWARAHFASTALDFDALVSQDALKRLIVRHIAWTIAGNGGEDLASEFERLGALRADAIASFRKMLHAQDPNQDNIVASPTDYVTGEQAPYRCW